MVGEIQKLDSKPDVYGYIVLGVIEGKSKTFLQSAWFKAEVYDQGLGIDYEIVVMEACHDYIILGNINHIPGNIVIEPEPVLKEIREYIDKTGEDDDLKFFNLSGYDMDTMIGIDNYAKNIKFGNP